jgi:hypothetical protein
MLDGRLRRENFTVLRCILSFISIVVILLYAVLALAAESMVCTASAVGQWAGNRLRIDYEIRLHFDDQKPSVSLRDETKMLELVDKAECIARGTVIKNVTIGEDLGIAIPRKSEVIGFGMKGCRTKDAAASITVFLTSPRSDAYPLMMRVDPWKDGMPFAMLDTGESLDGLAGLHVTGQCR